MEDAAEQERMIGADMLGFQSLPLTEEQRKERDAEVARYESQNARVHALSYACQVHMYRETAAAEEIIQMADRFTEWLQYGARKQ